MEEDPSSGEKIPRNKNELVGENVRSECASDNGLSPIEEETESYVSSKESSDDDTVSDEIEEFAEEAGFADKSLQNKEDVEEDCELEKDGPDAMSDLEDIQQECYLAVAGTGSLKQCAPSRVQETLCQKNEYLGNPTGKMRTGERLAEEYAGDGRQEIELSSSDEDTLNGCIMQHVKEATTADDDASGDNDDTKAIAPTRGLRETLENLKNKLAESERTIVTLKKQLSLEKFRSREFVLQCHEKCVKANELLKEELQNEMTGMIKAEMAKWQSVERIRVNEEISRISGIYLQGVARGLRSDAREWHVEDAKRTYEIIQKEKVRQGSESQGLREELKNIYEKIQRYLENLDDRNKKSYVSLRKQIDVLENHLKDDIVKLHDDDLKKLRLQVSLLCEEQNENRYGGSRKQQRGEWQEEVQRTSKDQVMKRTKELQVEEKRGMDDENFMKRLHEANGKELRRTEQSLKKKVEGYRNDLAKKMDNKISELWTAFEEFKHNFTLNNKYQERPKVFMNQIDMDNDTDSASDFYGDFINKGILKLNFINSDSDSEENENGSPPPKPARKKKSKHVSFRKNSLVEMPIVPQIRDDTLKRK